MGLITDGSQLRRAVLRALESRVAAALATLVDDSTLSVARPDGHDTVRTLIFESDHRCEVVIRSDEQAHHSARFHTDTRAAVDIELTQTGDDGPTTRTRAAEPAAFPRVKPGPIRFVYSLVGADGTSRRYQTEWVLLS